jgi:hypothetical protein
VANINVNTSKLKQYTSKEENISKNLKNLSSQLTACNNSLRNCMSSSGYGNIQRSINSVSQKLVTRADQISQMSRVLSNISSKYSETEKSISGGSIKAKEVFSKLTGGEYKGSIASRTVETAGTFLGINTSGKVAGDLLGGEVSTKFKSKIDFEKGEVDLIDAEVSAKGHLAKGEVSGNFGYLNGSAEGMVGYGAATGKLGISLFKKGKFSPQVEAKVKGEVAALKGKAETSFGTDDTNVHIKGDGSLMYASVEAGVAAGVITYKDKNGNVKQGYGVQASAGAEAYAAKGKVSGGLSLFGIDIDVGLEGKAGGAGAKASAQATTGAISGEIGLGLGVGLGLDVEVDYSKFVSNITNNVVTKNVTSWVNGLKSSW